MSGRRSGSPYGMVHMTMASGQGLRAARDGMCLGLRRAWAIECSLKATSEPYHWAYLVASAANLSLDHPYM